MSNFTQNHFGTPGLLRVIRLGLALLVSLAFAEAGAYAATIYTKPVGVQRLTLGEGRNFITSAFRNDPNSVAEVLGTNQVPAGGTEVAATVVDLWNQDSQTLTNRYYLSNALGFEGWREAGTFADASGFLLDQNKGMIMTIRAGEGSQTVYIKGSVHTQSVEQTIKGNKDYTLAASTFPAPIDLSQCGLVESGFQGGGSYTASDNLLFYDPVSQLFTEKVFYDDANTVWRNADATPTARQLQPGEAFLVRRRAASDMVWTNPLPYTLP